MKLACNLVLRICDRGYLDVAIVNKIVSETRKKIQNFVSETRKKFKILSVKLAEIGCQNIWSVKVGVHQKFD